VIGNVVGSGTAAVIDQFGARSSAYWSVDPLYLRPIRSSSSPPTKKQFHSRSCIAAVRSPGRCSFLPHDVSRVIARPFRGKPGAYGRTSNRRDFSIAPTGETLLDALALDGIPRAGSWKGRRSLRRPGHRLSPTPESNAEGIEAIRGVDHDNDSGLLFANLVDFDQLFGHRNDVPGFYRALQEFDQALPTLIDALREDDLLFITADHGNDPTTSSTDHARECVPLLAVGRAVQPSRAGRRRTFSDLGATIAEWLGSPFRGRGESFLSAMTAGKQPVSATKAKTASKRPAIGEHQIVALRERALAVMDRAYAPYSKFKVGAALLARDGSIHEGCNVENAAYPVGICAERGALATAVAHCARKFDAIVIATEAEEPTPPCGMCRQMLESFPPTCSSSVSRDPAAKPVVARRPAAQSLHDGRILSSGR